MYHTPIELSSTCMEDLEWWYKFLEVNPGNASQSGTAGTILGTWGDGSSTGTGGTIEEQDAKHMDTWMDTWNPRVQHLSSNWKELRTLLWTMVEKIYKSDKDWTGATVFYFTDNMTMYYVVMNGSSQIPEPELHKLGRAIKRLEFLMGCRIQVTHVPGVLMVDEGTDGLSQELWQSPQQSYRSSLTKSALGAVPFTLTLGSWH
jgi:hypothetical protein